MQWATSVLYFCCDCFYPRCNGLQAFRISVVKDLPMMHWAAGPMMHWAVGPMMHWAAGPMMHWAAVCRISVLKDCTQMQWAVVCSTLLREDFNHDALGCSVLYL